MNRADFLLIEKIYSKDINVTVLLFLHFLSFLPTDSRLFVIEIGVILFVDDHHGISRSTTLKVFRLKKEIMWTTATTQLAARLASSTLTGQSVEIFWKRKILRHSLGSRGNNRLSLLNGIRFSASPD